MSKRDVRASSARRGHPKAQPRILVAEDDEDVREFVAAALRGRGYDVIVASDGAQLLEEIADGLLFGTKHRIPDVIISDVRMPGFTGTEILAGLRDANWPTAIVLMTAYANDDIRAEAEEFGVDAFFEKPFDIDDLITAVVNISPMPRPPSGAWR